MELNSLTKNNKKKLELAEVLAPVEEKLLPEVTKDKNLDQVLP